MCRVPGRRRAVAPGQVAGSGQTVQVRPLRRRPPGADAPPTLAPPAQQVNDFIGATGYETLFLGTRGRVTEVEGLLYDVSAPALAGVRGFIESYYDGIGRVLVDTYGTAYPSARLTSFVPVDRPFTNGVYYFLRYKMLFEHNL